MAFYLRLSFLYKKRKKIPQSRFFPSFLREAAKIKKVLFLMAVPIRGEGEGVKGLAIKKKITFFGTFILFKKKFRLQLSSRGGEGGITP